MVETNPLATGSFLSDILFAISVAIMLLISIVHGIKMYQDLYTKQRKSLNHKRNPPPIDRLYTIIAWCTMLCLVTYLFSVSIQLAWSFAITHDQCLYLGVIAMGWYQIPKLFIYLIFIFRLHSVYGQTAYSYKIRSMYIWMSLYAVNAFVAITTGIIGILQWEIACVWDTNTSLIFSFLLSAIQDTMFAFGFIFAFTYPLWKVLSKLDPKMENDKSREKFLSISMKITILTVVALVSTLIFLILLSIFDSDIYPVDIVINSICICLMTPYYEDIYYQHLCCCCIRCCSPKKSKKHMKDDNKISVGNNIVIDIQISNEFDGSEMPLCDKDIAGI